MAARARTDAFLPGKTPVMPHARGPLFGRFALPLAALALIAGLGACAKGFQVNQYAGSNERLYAAGVREIDRHHWDNAVAAFEKLTLDLPARDTLLPRVYFYLGQAHEKKDEHLLAAQSFSRLTEAFPDDSLADDALFESGESYRKLWRKPVLDAQYGQTALATYRTLLSLYPNSPLRERANAAITRLEEMFAIKDYDSGMFYLRRKAFDSAIIYFRDVVKNYPNARHSRAAQLRLVDAYRAIRYKEDATEVCNTLRQSYPGDREVRETCGAAPAAAATATPTPGGGVR